MASHEYDLRDMFYHQVSQETTDKMTEVRRCYYELNVYIQTHCPVSRELSLAKTYLEDSLMRAIQALAVMEGTPIPIGEVAVPNTALPPSTSNVP